MVKTNKVRQPIVEEDESSESEMRKKKRKCCCHSLIKHASPSSSKKATISKSNIGQKRSISQIDVLEQRISGYNRKMSKKQSTFHVASKDNFSLQTFVEVDFYSMGPEDMSDTPRQVIIKKKYFPKDMLGVITKAERVDFKKNGDELEEQLVCDILFILDLKGCAFKRSLGGKVDRVDDYFGVSIRFHLPKRFQDKFAGLDPSRLVGSILMSPEHDTAVKREGC